MPEVSLNAVRVADLVNGGSSPILPGRAMLFEDGAFVGRSELDFVAPGETFSLFLGVHDGVKIERTLDKKSSALRRRGKRTEMALSFLVTAENLGSTPLAIELSERIPVAQTEEIEVSDVELPRKIKPDAQGVVRWTETIPPRTKLACRIGYRLEYPTDFVVRSRAAETHDSRRRRRRRPSPPGAEDVRADRHAGEEALTDPFMPCRRRDIRVRAWTLALIRQQPKRASMERRRPERGLGCGSGQGGWRWSGR